MREMNMRSLDLNLLVCLKALLEEQHVSRAAEKVSLSQPAMSRALAKLRKIFKDPLLVKSSKGLILTTRANKLALPLKNIFAEINQIIHPPVTDPAKMVGEVIIATRDNELVTVLPQVIHQAFKQAPEITFRLIPPAGDIFGQLDRQEVDFVLTPDTSKSGTLFRQVLYKETFACLASAKNPVVKKELDLKTYLAMKHCVVTGTGYGPGIVGGFLAKQRLARKVAVQLSNYLSAAHIVENEDLLISVPKHIGDAMIKQANLKMMSMPFHIPSLPIYLYWHAKNQTNPLHQWVRNIIYNYCKAL